MSCNYECEYCSQRFVPRVAETNPTEVHAFVAGLDGWVTMPPERIEFWGGEPLVYIKTLRPLAHALRRKYPAAGFSVITNGSLLNADINQWLDDMGFSVGISHDGPGQHVRGPDPLDDPEKRAAILDLYRRLAPNRRVSFNAMLNRANISRAAIQQFFTDLTGDPGVMIAEGAFVDAYDPGGLALSLSSDEAHSFRRTAFQEIRQGKADRVSGARDRVASFVNSIRLQRPASSVAQKCGMDHTDSIAVDLRGN
ncbi:MAG: Fe-S oxidoreductase, partial [Betaproteobacteria bacterium]|nr:Fe-S oxidoreductase [Betaproteobacteria bacterium]